MNELPSNTDVKLREQLQKTMSGEESHIDFAGAVDDFPVDSAGLKLWGAPHSAWELLEHLRIAQHDILEFSRNPRHNSPKWPEGYWPESAAPPDQQAWKASVSAFEEEAKALNELVADASKHLFDPIEGGQGQTLLREALVVAAHNSYHLGQLMFLKKMLAAAAR